MSLVALVLVALPAAAAHGQSASNGAASSADDGVDAAVLPGDDFFAYANGAWLKATEIPAGKGEWSAGTEIAERTRRQVAALLDDAKAAPAGSDPRKVADFRAPWTDDAAIEARGIATLRPMLARIDRIRDKAGLARYLGSELPADVDPLNLGVYDSRHVLGLAVEEGNHGEKENVAYLLQGGLGLPDREPYLGSDANAQARRAALQAAMADVLARLGSAGHATDAAASSATHRAAAAMALETAIARSHATPEASAEDRNADNVWTRADLAREAPGMDWSAFLVAAGLGSQQTFVAWQPSALTGLAALVASEPLPAWKDYLRVRLVARYADVLPHSLSAPAMALRGVSAANEPLAAREQRALAATQAAMGDAIGRMYAERYFPPTSKARVQAIVANVAAAFARRVEAVTWMTPATRSLALAKLKTVYVGVGYPERWPDFAGLVIDPRDAVGNLQRVAARDRRLALARLGQPADPAAWRIAPQTAGAVLIFQQSAYDFAAALLQPPKFDAAASDAATYGAIGAIMGHDITHYIDTLGADYEIGGRQRRWWTGADMAGYRAATAPLVRQYAAYSPLAGVVVDGERSLTENLADLGGLVAAFDAHRLALGGLANDQEAVRRKDREFFIGYARGWRAKYRDDALKAQAASDHAPEPYRVSTVRNLDAWYDAFDVKPGQRLYLAPMDRVRVW